MFDFSSILSLATVSGTTGVRQQFNLKIRASLWLVDRVGRHSEPVDAGLNRSPRSRAPFNVQ
jgi:hypothetical protein